MKGTPGFRGSTAPTEDTGPQDGPHKKGLKTPAPETLAPRHRPARVQQTIPDIDERELTTNVVYCVARVK